MTKTPKLKPFFYKLSSLNPILFKQREKNELREILVEFIEPYLKLYTLQQVDLDEVLYSYKLRGGVEVKIGCNKSGIYYVVSEPVVDYNVYKNIVDRVVDIVVKGELNQNPTSIFSMDIKDADDYVFFKVLSGLGPLSPLVLDPYVEDIYVSRENKRILVIHNKLSWSGWLKTNIVLEPALVDKLILSLSRRTGKHVSLVNPIVEGSYGASLRLSLIYGDTVSTVGSSLVLRKKTLATWTITKLIAEGVLDALIAAYLWLLLEMKGWIIIAGHVGSGKTTLLQGLLTLIPPGRKVIVIEDTPELSGSTGVWEQLVEKTSVFNESTQIDSYTLLKTALRRRPDYIVIGEVRGVEARLLVQASRLGHGVLNTIHADSSESVLKRLTAPPISIPKNLLNNIWSIIIVGPDQRGRRRILSISEVDSESNIVSIFEKTREVGIEDITERTIRLKSREFDVYEELEKRRKFLENLVEKQVFDLNLLREELSKFYYLSLVEETQLTT